MPVGDQTVAGVRDLFRRFSHFISRVIWKKVDWSSNEGHWSLGGEISRGLFVFSSALGGESPAEGYSAVNQVVVQLDVFNLPHQMMAMQRYPDRYSSEN